MLHPQEQLEVQEGLYITQSCKRAEARSQNLLVPCFGELALGSESHVRNLGSEVFVASKMKL